MNGLEWMFSAVLALVFLIVGVIHAFRYEVARKRLPWVADVPRALVGVIGAVEILGAVGLILPDGHRDLSLAYDCCRHRARNSYVHGHQISPPAA